MHYSGKGDYTKGSGSRNRCVRHQYNVSLPSNFIPDSESAAVSVTGSPTAITKRLWFCSNEIVYP